ncbi:MAG TPA: hypothetical protein P5514_10215 [Bacteroidales bacterium]|nr:hypothetical protein [Bacteroidales bacterium]HRX97308.1 hypothetical protein [Bacteroidales bacterium]
MYQIGSNILYANILLQIRNMTRNIIVFLLLILIITACRVKIPEVISNIWFNYEVGDSLIFENQFGNRDTMVIVESELKNMGWRPIGVDQPPTGKYRPLRCLLWICVREKINTLTGEIN